MTNRQSQTSKFKRIAPIAALFVAVGLSACLQGGERQPAAPTPVAASAFGFFYMDEGSAAKLAYGQPQSDDVAFMLECDKGSRRIQVTQAGVDAAQPRLTLASSGQSAMVPARAEAAEGALMLVGSAPADAAPLQAFRRSGRLSVGAGPHRLELQATAAERRGIETFFTQCQAAPEVRG